MKVYHIIFLIVITAAGSFGAERLGFKYIAGVPCAEFNIVNRDKSLKVYLLIDIGQINPLIMHNDFAGLFPADAEISLEFDGGLLEGLKYVTADISGIDEFSRMNANELDEIPLWGILGSSAFDSEVIMVDLQKRILDYGSLEIPPGYELPIEEKQKRYISEIEPDPGYKVKAAITTSDYETVFDMDCAALAGSETADFKNCQFSSLDLRQFSALRVRDEYSGEIGIAECMIANSFWQNFVVYLDRDESRIVLEKHPGGVISDLTEQEYFNSFAHEDADAIADCLDKYPDSRLANEANRLLLDIAVESGDREQVKKSIERFIKGQKPEQSAEKLIVYAHRSIENKELEAGRIFLDYAGSEILKTNEAPLLGGKINSYRGWMALNNKQLPEARRYLLSALFINPEDALANYLTGCYHQAGGELIRAWARYLKAALAPEPSAEAVKALKMLGDNEIFKERFNIDDACDFLDGRIWQEKGQLSKPAKMLKYRGGSLLKLAIDKLQEQIK